MSQIKQNIMQNNKSSVYGNQDKQNNKMKRKKFFLASAVAVTGIFTFAKLPLSIFRAKAFKEKNESIKITENPNAVKRKSNQFGNG